MSYKLESPNVRVASPKKIHITTNLKSPTSHHFSYVGWKISKYDLVSGEIQLSPKINYNDLSEPPLAKENVIEDFKKLAKKENFLEKAMFFLREMEKSKEIQSEDDIVFFEEDLNDLYLFDVPKIHFKTTKTDSDTKILLMSQREDMKNIPPNILRFTNDKMNDFSLSLYIDKIFDKSDCQRILSSILHHCSNHTRLLLEV